MFSDPTGMVPEAADGCGCPDPPCGGPIFKEELDEVVISVTLNERGRAKVAENKLRLHYNYADWATRLRVQEDHASLLHTWLALEAQGVYPSPSRFEDYYKGTSEAWSKGWLGWDKDGPANFWMNFASYSIGGTLLLLSGSSVVADGLAGSSTLSLSLPLGSLRPSLSNYSSKYINGFTDGVVNSTLRTGRGAFDPRLYQSLEATSLYRLPNIQFAGQNLGPSARWAIGIGLSGLGAYGTYKSFEQSKEDE